MKLATIAVVSLMLSSLANSAIVSPLNSEARLLDHIFANYSPKVRPLLNHSQPVKLELDLMLKQILDVYWTRELTTWDPSEFGGLTSITVEPSMVWVPDLIVYTRASTSEIGGGSLYKTIDTNVILEHTGNVTWLSPAILKTQCVINSRYFPFDSHTCQLTFGSWTHQRGKFLMTASYNSIDTEVYSYDKEWSLEATKAVSQDLKYNCCPEPYSVVSFSLSIRRRPTFYVFNLIMPCGLITVLTLFSFLLPPNSGERVSFVITVLLSLSVYMLIVTEKIPQSAEIPISSNLFMCMMVEISIALVATCFIIRIHNYNKPMPPSFKIFVNGWLARVLRMKKEKEVKNGGEKKNRKEASRTCENNQGFGKDDDDDATTVDHHQNGVTIDNVVPEENRKKRKTTENISLQSRVSIRQQETDVEVAEAVQSKEKQEDLQDEWVFAAKVLDRLSLLTLSLSMCATLMWIFFTAPGWP